MAFLFFSFLFSLTAHSQEVPILTSADTSFADVFQIMDNFYSSQEDSIESTSEEEGNEENQFYRWANFWKGRLANSENIFKNAGQASALMAEAIYDYDFCEIPDDDAVVWEKLGPSNSDGDTENNQGRIKSMSVHPTNPDIIVVGAEQGGIWKTVDGGANWYNTTDQNGLSIVGAKQIVRHPLEPNYMYAATGNAEGIGFLAIEGRDYGMGVLVSIDGGENWERTFDISLDDGRESLIGDIAVSPLSTIEEVTIYAASSHRIIKYVGSPLPNINAPFDEQWQVIHSDSEYYEEPGVTGTNGTGNIKVESDGTVWFTDRFDLYKIEPGASTAQSMLLTPPCENTDSLQRRTDFHVSINDNDELAVFASYYYNDAVCTNLFPFRS